MFKFQKIFCANWKKCEVDFEKIFNESTGTLDADAERPISPGDLIVWSGCLRGQFFFGTELLFRK